ncbi:hypothetical protein YYE_03991 [Plasmodium vinckei vinckei]|uniref:PIR protein CIR protein n=1 Tax=Plasmodium vinckei vinckei TaxID=54757 RepID=A0A081IBA0_PLAVN|nr:hypothetical protein YYE_03991 [Plasmodium vinckei vinckei]
MDKNVCNLFIKVDELFIKGEIKENEFNKSYTNFCHKGVCSTNYDRIGALCEYLLTELQKVNNKSKGSKDNANMNYDFVFMWLADKFLKIGNDDSFSISDYYEDVIVQSGSNFNCWDKLDIKKYFKDSNLSIMSTLYFLFMNICNSMVKNDISKFDINKFKTNDFEYYKSYNSIKSKVSNCYPYVQLLTDLKKNYDEYRRLAIKENSKKKNNDKFLNYSRITNKDSQPKLLFQSDGCIKLHASFGQPRQKPKPKTQPSELKSPPNDSQNKKESHSSNIGEELNFENIKDYSVRTFEKYSPHINNIATKIKHHIRDMVTSNFINIVGIGAKHLKAIENVKFPKFQIQVLNNKEKEPENLKKEKVDPPIPSQTTQGTTVSSNGISSKAVDVPGNNLMGLNTNITRLLSFKFEGNKVAIIALTVVSITIFLAIMYWYLYYGSGKPMKKKKMGNKIINLVDEKGRRKRVINPIDRKRDVKTNINSDYEEKGTIVICNILLDVDKLFTDGTVDVNEFNKPGPHKMYCPYENGKLRDCKNNYERINALGEYLYKKIPGDSNEFKDKGIRDNLHIEFFMMWLGDKLFKVDKDYKKTLEESYKKNLESITGNFEYWGALNNKQVYMNATNVRMYIFYNLLSNICKTIIELNKNLNDTDPESLKNHGNQCINLYRNIYESVKECKSYVHLLDSLKTIYEYIKSYKITDNISIEKSKKVILFESTPSLTTSDHKNTYFIYHDETLSFDDKGCEKVKLKDEKDGEKGSLPDLQITQGNGLPKKPKTGNQGKTLLDPNIQRILEAHKQKLKAGKVPRPQTRPRPPTHKIDGKSPPRPQPQPKPQQKSGTQPQPQSPVPNVKPAPAQTAGVSSPPINPAQQPREPFSQKDSELKKLQKEGSNHQDGQNVPKIESKDPESSKGNTMGGAGDTSDGKGGKDNKKVGSNSDTGVKSSGVSGGADGGKVDGQGSGASGGSVSVQGDQGSTGTQGGGTGGSSGVTNAKKGGGGGVEGSSSSGGLGTGQGDATTTKGDPGVGGGSGADKDSQGSSGNQKKLPGKSSDGNSVPVQPGTAPSGTDTTPSLLSQPPTSQGLQKLGSDPQSRTKDSDKGLDPSKSEKKGPDIQKGNSDSVDTGKGVLGVDTGGSGSGPGAGTGDAIGGAGIGSVNGTGGGSNSQVSTNVAKGGLPGGSGGTDNVQVGTDNTQGSSSNDAGVTNSGASGGKVDVTGSGTSGGSVSVQRNHGVSHGGSISPVSGTGGSGDGTDGGAGSSGGGPGVGQGNPNNGSGGTDSQVLSPGSDQGGLPGGSGGSDSKLSSEKIGGGANVGDAGGGTGSTSSEPGSGIGGGASINTGDTSGGSGARTDSASGGAVGGGGSGSSDRQGASGVGTSVSVSGKGGADTNTGGKVSEPGVGGNSGNGGVSVNTGSPVGGQGGTGSGPGGGGGIGAGSPGSQGDTNNKVDSSNQGDSLDGSKPSGDQSATHSSGIFSGNWPSLWGSRLDPMRYIPSASDIYQAPMNILANAGNKITSAYNSTVDGVKNAYYTTVDGVKNAYYTTVDGVKYAYYTTADGVKYVYYTTADSVKNIYDTTVNNITNTYKNTMTNIANTYNIASDYIGDALNKTVNQLNPFDSSSQSGDDQSGPNILGGGVDTSDQSQQNSSLSSPPPLQSPPSSLPSPQTPSDSTSPQTSSGPTSSQTPSDPTSTQLPKLLDPQSGPTQISKISDKQSTSNAGQGVLQTVTSTQVTLSNSGISSSNGGNVNKTSGIDVKMNEKPSIWCIAQNKKCDIVGIGIIGISIFCFLAIMYKYLSFGSAKKSKKKNMKRVIKLIDGKRKTQIIISSNDRSKHLKSVINSVGRKKGPLLNIYKLMQADPVPFINLFFLLIFFVYKRNRDFIEL